MAKSPLRAVFRLSAGELYEILTSGKLLSRNKFLYLDNACIYLGTRDVIIGAGYIDNATSAKVAKSLLPERPYPTCYLTVRIEPGCTRYLTTPSSVLSRSPSDNKPIHMCTWLEDYFPDVPDTAVILGRVDRNSIVSIEFDDPYMLKELIPYHPSISWWAKFKRRYL